MNNNLGNYPKYVQRYLDLVDSTDLTTAFQNQQDLLIPLLESISETKATFAYAANKWTLKELLQHCIDAERIFQYRALCFARKEMVSLPGFDEDSYAAHSNANSRTWADLSGEFILVRRSTEALFKSFSKESLLYSGMANNNESSVISIGFLIVGHMQHHMNIIQERYLP